MGTVIVVAVLIIIILFALRGTFRHMRGEGGCCGGGDVPGKVKKQKLSQVIDMKKVKIEGMHCDNCRRSVENVLNSFPGVNASVNLKKGEALLRFGIEAAVTEEELRAAVEKAGYRIKEE